MRTVTTDELQRLRQQDVNVINVLGEEQFKEKHIPGSRNVPMDRDDFVEKVSDLVGYKKSPVVVYCADKSCNASPKAAKKLEQAGFGSVFDYEGGVQEWEKAGLNLEKGA